MTAPHTDPASGMASTYDEIERAVVQNETVSLRLDSETVLQCEQLLRHLPRRRVVLAGRMRSQPVVVKIFSARGKARREFSREYHNLYQLAKQGLPVPEPVLRIEQSGWCAFVLPRIDGVSAGKVYRQRELEPEDLQRRLAGLVVDLFRAGFVQTDLHLDNFMLSDDRFYMLDAGSIKRVAPEPVASFQLQDSLATLLTQFYPVDVDSRILDSVAPTSGNADKLSRMVLSRRRARLGTLMRKSLRSSTRYRVIRNKNMNGVCIRHWSSQVHRILEKGMDEAIKEGEVLKDGNSATVVRYRENGIDWVIKRYNVKGFTVAIKRLFLSRARRSWKNALWLQFNGLATPAPVAFLREKRKRVRARHYYISEHVDGDLLKTWSAESLLRNDPVLEELRAIFCVMREPGFIHGDFKAANFLVDCSRRVHLLDLDAMRSARPGRRQIKAIRGDRRRFLRNWPEQYRSRIEEAIGY